MNRDSDNLIDVTWVAWCAERLRGQWPRADATSLEEAARELWADESLRSFGPIRAAEEWLRRGMPGQSRDAPPLRRSAPRTMRSVRFRRRIGKSHSGVGMT